MQNEWIELKRRQDLESRSGGRLVEGGTGVLPDEDMRLPRLVMGAHVHHRPDDLATASGSRDRMIGAGSRTGTTGDAVLVSSTSVVTDAAMVTTPAGHSDASPRHGTARKKMMPSPTHQSSKFAMAISGAPTSTSTPPVESSTRIPPATSPIGSLDSSTAMTRQSATASRNASRWSSGTTNEAYPTMITDTHEGTVPDFPPSSNHHMTRQIISQQHFTQHAPMPFQYHHQQRQQPHELQRLEQLRFQLRHATHQLQQPPSPHRPLSGGSMDETASCGTKDSDGGYPYDVAEQQPTTVVSLGQELAELSKRERELVYDEVHGVADIRSEESDFIQQVLAQFKERMKRLPHGGKKRRALDRALFLQPSLASDTDFHLMFLRAERYNPHKAAQRMATYFQNKLELWGESKLVKKITLDDLSAQDTVTTSTTTTNAGFAVAGHTHQDDSGSVNTTSGIFQIIPQKDQSGRTIFFTRPYHCHLYRNWKDYARFVWYQIMTGLEDETAQVNGIVSVVCCHFLSLPQQRHFLELASAAAPVLDGLPCRMAGFHFCHSPVTESYMDTTTTTTSSDHAQLGNNDHRREPSPPPSYTQSPSHMTPHPQLSIFGGKETRLRFRTHSGTMDANKSVLQSFGIPVDAFPFLQPDGVDLDENVHQHYIQERRRVEQEHWRLSTLQEESSGLVSYPTKNDVLVGRGRPYQEFQGNLRYSLLIDMNLSKYLKATNRFEKTCVFMDIVKLIQENNGRFLQRNSQGWEIVKDNVAREKVSHIFRTKTARLLSQQQEQPSIIASTTTSSVASVSSSSASPPPEEPASSTGRRTKSRMAPARSKSSTI